MWVNSVVLKMMGYDAATPDPPNGKFERDPQTGELTGWLKEAAGWKVYDKVPIPTESQLRNVISSGIARAHQFGLSGVHCCEYSKSFHFYQTLLHEGKLNLRMYHMIAEENLDDAIKIGLQTGFGNEWLRLGHVKLFSDGALGSQTAEMLAPYENAPLNYGISTLTETELYEAILRANRAGLSTAIHAIGDRANRKVLDAYERVLEKIPTPKIRNRIEHVQLLDNKDHDRFAKLDIVASMQPIHVAADIENIEKYWGKRGENSYIFRTLLDHGSKLAFGSDAPIESIDPLAGIYAAVERKFNNNPELNSWNETQKLTVHEAVHGFTLGAAFASGEAHIKGSIAAGKLADFVVLDKDIFSIPAKEILSTKVLALFIDGIQVFGENLTQEK